MSEYDHSDQPSQNTPQSQSPPKSLFVQAIDAFAIILSIAITLVIAPTLIAWTSPYFVGFMSATLAAGFNDFFEILWWFVCCGLVYSAALSLITMVLLRRATKSIVSGLR